MKKIEMDFSEYEKMVELIQKQRDQLEEFKNGDNIILVDNRFNYYYCISNNWSIGKVPRIIGNEVKAKQMLKEEFDNLYNDMLNMQIELDELRMFKSNNLAKTKKKNWWNSLLNLLYIYRL